MLLKSVNDPLVQNAQATLLYNIGQAVICFKISLVFGLLSISFVLKKIQITWFISKTNRNYHTQNIEIMDVLIAAVNYLLLY